MSNPFDQFDAPATGANPFDQFDPPKQGAVKDATKRTGRSLVDQPGALVQSLGEAFDAVMRGMGARAATESMLAGLPVEPDAVQQALRTENPAARLVKDTGRQMRKDAGELYTGDFAPDAARDRTLLAKVADNVGPLAAAVATPGGVLSKTATGMALNSQGAADDAERILIERGATTEKARAEAARQWVLNLPAGALESVGWGKLLGRYGKSIAEAVAQKWGKTAAQRIVQAAVEQGAIEGGEEWLQTVAQNAAAAATYDENRKLTEGGKDALLLGSIMGGGMAGTVQAGAEVADKLDTGRNQPERPEDLQAQQKQLQAGERAAQMFPLGTKELPLPEGFARVETPRGVFHFDPDQITADEILSASKQGRENLILGLGPHGKQEVEKRAAAGEPVAVVTERGPQGEELRAAVATPSTEAETREAIESAKSPTSTVQIERLDDVLEKRIEGDLPDTDSKQHVAGRTAQDLQRIATAEVDYPALWRDTVDAVLAAGVTPKQFTALENMLAMLADKKTRKEAGLRLKITPERLDNLLGETVLDSALRGSKFARLRDALAKSPERIQELLAEFQRARAVEAPAESTAQPVPAPEVAKPTPEPSPTPAARTFKMPAELAGANPRYGYKEAQFELTFQSELDKALYILAQKNPSKQDAKYLAAVLEQTGMNEETARQAGRGVRERIKALAQGFPLGGKLTVPDATAEARRQKMREQIAAEAQAEETRRAELDRKKTQAEAALREAAEKRKAESERLAAIDRTGRDPQTGLIADLRKVPTQELENFDWEKDRYQQGGKEVKPEDIEAVLLQRARDEERAAAETDGAGYTLLDLLKGKKPALQAAGLSRPLRLLTPKEARAAGKMGGEHARLRDGSGAFAYFTKDGLAEDDLREQLAELGFPAADVNAAYELIERALAGEDVRPGGAQFARRKSPAPGADQTDLFAGGETGGDTMFNLQGEEAQDFTGTVEKQAEARAAKKEEEGRQGSLFAKRSKETPELAAIEAKLLRGAADRDAAARLVNRYIDVQEGKGQWTKRWEKNAWRDLSITEEQARALNRAVRDFDEGAEFVWPDETVRKDALLTYARRKLPDMEALATQWWRNLETLAPGLAKESELRFGDSSDLVEEGIARRDELTGEEEAARWRDLRAKREIFYLFEKALRRNTSDLTRLNLQHEMAHAFWDTLDRATQRRLEQLFREEVEHKTGPLFAAAVLRENVALGATEDVQEWFAERMAHANDGWAKRRITAAAQGDTLLQTIAAKFRALLAKLRELMERHLVLNGYDDALLRDFRRFLDQGTRWTGSEGPGSVAFARRAKTDAQTRAELAAQTPVVYASELPTDKAAARALADTLYPTGEAFTNRASGRKIKMVNSGLRKLKSHSADLRTLKIIPGLKTLVEEALPILQTESDGKRWHHYAVPAVIDGESLFIRLVAFENQEGQLQMDVFHDAHATPREMIEGPASDRSPHAMQDSRGIDPSKDKLVQWWRSVNHDSEPPAFARRARTDAEFTEALRNFDRLERQLDDYNSRGEKPPREVLTALSDAREVLEESWPGWRETAKERRAELDANTATAPEPEPGVTADEDAREIDPNATAWKRSRLEASSFRPPGPLNRWIGGIGKLLGNFRSAIPELPGGAKGREFARFRQGFRMLKAATENVRREAEERIAHVLEPIQQLGAGAIDPYNYERLVNVNAAIKRFTDRGEVAPANLHRELAALEDKLESLPYHLFRKTVLYRDLWFRTKIQNAEGNPITLPMGLVREEIDAALQDLHAKIDANPQKAAIEESLRRHYDLVKTTREDLLARGYIIPEELRNPLYFPHLILDRFSGRMQNVKLDTAEDFRGYLQQLVGSAKDIETDYLTAMYFHMGQVLAHNARQDIVADYWQPYDIKGDLIEEAKELNAQRSEQGLGPLHWRQLVPKGHVVYTVDDRLPLRPEYMVNRSVLAERLGVELGDGDLRERLRELGLDVTLTADDFTAALQAGERQQWVVPQEVAAALDAIVQRESEKQGLLGRVIGTPQALWKRWILYAPHNVVRYTYGNLVSDLEKLFSADPAVFKELLPAYREVRAFMEGGEPTEDLREAYKRGVVQSVTAAEVGEISQAQRFEPFLTSQDKFIRMMKRPFIWGRTVNELREAAFRYAKFKADLARMRRGERPVYAGAYWKDVEAIGDTKPGSGDALFAKAAEIARKTFVDYGDITVNGETLRRYLVPFYSWMEGNFKYHANLFRNLADMSTGAALNQVARGGLTAASRVVLPRSVAGVLLRLALPYVAAALWNNSGDREELEKTLSEEDRRRFHLIVGKDAKGKTIVVYAPTALSDVMEWFGGNEFARLAGEYLTGRTTLNQLVHDWVRNTPKATLNKAVGGVSPHIKTVFEGIARKGIFPDVTDARNIADHDLKWHILGNMTDGATADWIRRAVDDDYYSARTFTEWAQQAILQARRRDPEEWGYWATLERVEEWQEAHGGVVDFGVNNKADAKLLRSFRRAIRAADVPAAIEFYHKLLDAGYTAERFAASVRASDPLQTIKREHRQEFFAALTPEHQEDVRRAYRYAQRMQAFKRQERRLFPSEKASASYKERFAQNPRDDVFAGLMFDAAERSDEEEELKAEQLLKAALRPR